MFHHMTIRAPCKATIFRVLSLVDRNIMRGKWTNLENEDTGILGKTMRTMKFRSIWNDDVTCCYGNDGCFDSLVVRLKQLANHIW